MPRTLRVQEPCTSQQTNSLSEIGSLGIIVSRHDVLESFWVGNHKHVLLHNLTRREYCILENIVI